MTKIEDLKFDDKNFNKHTEKGMSMLEKSLRDYGAGRSILVDKDNNIIAGNGIVEAAGNIGLEDLQIVESDGSKIIAVKRTDISLDSAEGRQMALADNATAAEDLAWDNDAIDEVSQQFDFDPGEWISGWNKSEIEEDDDKPITDDQETSRVMILSVTAYGRSKDDDAVLARELKQEDADKLLDYLKKNEADGVLDKLVEAIKNV